ncbi:MerR family transcriptional regulator [Tahibacter amnicola]|uniref:MerR family DNA-binding transcriptional regulator n=1 Tax=Tahibacter amnicola TaxID=2976241 RepID=A0ABY6B8N3_9GAMM|nr:MerR family DNA-binding transcriptional regulator [Tahibacter amnicola]UXI66438.1 MerR family DNA-binding transcriptional regulator [Tahibacter amnicola]
MTRRGKTPSKNQAAAAQKALDTHRETVDGDLFGIADLCREFDVTARALRFYEDKGLLAPRRINGTRIYSRRDRARLALILRAKAIGSPLEEIRHYLDLYGDHGEGRVQQLTYVVTRTDALMQELREKRANIDALLAELQLINENCQRQLDERRRGGAPRSVAVAR